MTSLFKPTIYHCKNYYNNCNCKCCEIHKILHEKKVIIDYCLLTKSLKYTYCFILMEYHNMRISKYIDMIYIIMCLHRYKYLFWCLKYKQKFRDWLWLKVRKPKIEQIYSPNNLNKLLNEMINENDESEFEDIINNWNIV